MMPRGRHEFKARTMSPAQDHEILIGNISVQKGGFYHGKDGQISKTTLPATPSTFLSSGMSDETSVDQANKKVEAEVARRKRVVRNFPAAPFEESSVFAKEIYVFGSGQPVRRLSLFDHLGRAPDSGASRQSITNASKYNLIKGSYASEFLELTPDAKTAVDDDVSPRERARARVRLAIEEIEPFKRLYERFVGNKLPAKAAMTDAIKEFEVSAESAEEAVDTFIVNLRFVWSSCYFVRGLIESYL
jgi:hypothetical protein